MCTCVCMCACVRVRVRVHRRSNAPLQVVPTLQPHPGVFNEQLAAGLDLVLVELRRRRMRAIMTLSNQWSWSGGFATFLVWAEGKTWRDIPYPSSDLHGYWVERKARGAQLPYNQRASWDEFQKWAGGFYSNPVAVSHFMNTVRWVLNRRNSHSTDRYKYSEDPTILAWEVRYRPLPSVPHYPAHLPSSLPRPAALIATFSPPAHVPTAPAHSSFATSQGP